MEAKNIKKLGERLYSPTKETGKICFSDYATDERLTDSSTTYTPIKNVYWCPPIQLSASQIIKKGIEKRRLRKNILSKIWNGIKSYFTELYVIGQEEKPLYDVYLEPKEKGELGIATPPKLEHDEQLITQVALSIHQSVPAKGNE